MEVELLREFLIEDALVIVPVLLFFGYILKGTPNIDDWLIPYILLAVGIALALLLLGLSAASFIQGVLVAGVAVLTHQLIKQPKKKNLP